MDLEPLTIKPVIRDHKPSTQFAPSKLKTFAAGAGLMLLPVVSVLILVVLINRKRIFNMYSRQIA